MRITENMRLAQNRLALARNSERTYELSDIASSGRKVQAPSDDPGAYSSIVRRGDKIARMQSRRDNVDRAHDDLQLAEAALASASDLMVRVRGISVQMADGALRAWARAVAAKEVAQLRQQLVAIANTKGGKGYLFHGTDTATEPYDQAGNYQGANDGEVQVEYADNKTMVANISGRVTFTAAGGGTNIFSDLLQLEADLAADNQAGAFQAISQMDQGHQQLTEARAEAGTRMRRLSSASDINANLLALSTEQQAKEQEGDLTETFSQLANAQNAYQRSLAVTRQVLAMASALERF